MCTYLDILPSDIKLLLKYYTTNQYDYRRVLPYLFEQIWYRIIHINEQEKINMINHILKSQHMKDRVTTESLPRYISGKISFNDLITNNILSLLITLIIVQLSNKDKLDLVIANINTVLSYYNINMLVLYKDIIINIVEHKILNTITL